VVEYDSRRLSTERVTRLPVSALRRPSIRVANSGVSNSSLDIGLPAIPSRNMPYWLRARAWAPRKRSLVGADNPDAEVGVNMHSCRAGHAFVA
jgi:hypothetical protein